MSEDFCPICGNPDGAGHDRRECFDGAKPIIVQPEAEAIFLTLVKALGHEALKVTANEATDQSQKRSEGEDAGARVD
jgi:hypothetical protein